MKAFAKIPDKNSLRQYPDYIASASWSQLSLTPGMEYNIHCISLTSSGIILLQLVDDASNPPHWYPSVYFDVYDPTIPHDWICNVLSTGPPLIIGPEFIGRDYLSYSDMLTKEPEPIRLFFERLERLLAHDTTTFINQAKSRLSPRALEDMEQLIPLDEISYALEIACSELMEVKLLTAEEHKKCIELGISLGLDEGETINWDFWKKLTKYQPPPGVESAPPVVEPRGPMKVRAREVGEDKLPKYPDGSPILERDQVFVTPDIEYEVQGMCIFDGNTFFRLEDDRSTRSWYPAELFTVSDGTIPSHWICNVFHKEPKLVMGPESLARDLVAFNAAIEEDIGGPQIFRSRY